MRGRNGKISILNTGNGHVRVLWCTIRSDVRYFEKSSSFPRMYYFNGLLGVTCDPGGTFIAGISLPLISTRLSIERDISFLHVFYVHFITPFQLNSSQSLLSTATWEMDRALHPCQSWSWRTCCWMRARAIQCVPFCPQEVDALQTTPMGPRYCCCSSQDPYSWPLSLHASMLQWMHANDAAWQPRILFLQPEKLDNIEEVKVYNDCYHLPSYVANTKEYNILHYGWRKQQQSRYPCLNEETELPLILKSVHSTTSFTAPRGTPNMAAHLSFIE